LRFLHFLNIRLTDGGEVVKAYTSAALYPQEDFWYSFLLEAESAPVAEENIWTEKKGCRKLYN
jgi:hypothetical protein